MFVILMGPQGSGKGTQAGRLAPRLGLVTIATGELFRSAIAAGTDLGRRIKDIYDRGELVPDDLTVRLVEEKLDEVEREQELSEAVRGALFDGFPRTRPTPPKRPPPPPSPHSSPRSPSPSFPSTSLTLRSSATSSPRP